MKVYGWEDVGVYRGELVAAEVRASDLDFGMESLAAELGWEVAFTRFAEARAALIAAMERENIEDDLVTAVRNTKASYVPVSFLLGDE